MCEPGLDITIDMDIYTAYEHTQLVRGGLHRVRPRRRNRSKSSCRVRRGRRGLPSVRYVFLSLKRSRWPNSLVVRQ